MSSLAVPIPELGAPNTKVAQHSVELVGTKASAVLQVNGERTFPTLAGYNVPINAVVWGELLEESFSLPPLQLGKLPPLNQGHAGTSAPRLDLVEGSVG